MLVVSGVAVVVSKLFRAYGLYNCEMSPHNIQAIIVSKLFRAYGLYNQYGNYIYYTAGNIVSKLFRAYGLYNSKKVA